MHVRVTSARRNGGDFLPCRAGEGAGTMTAHFKERPMNRTTHLQSPRAFGVVWLRARVVAGVMAKRSAGNPAPI